MTLGGSLTLNCYPDNLQINMYRQAVSHNNLGTIFYRVSKSAEGLKIRMGASFDVVCHNLPPPPPLVGIGLSDLQKSERGAGGGGN